MRGTGPEHHLIVAHRGEQQLLASAYELPSAGDLERASKMEGASGIEPIDDLGGGRRVRLTDLDGNGVELVHSMDKTAPLDVPTQVFNSASDRERRRNAVVRPDKGPSHVLRLGHVVIRSPNVQALSVWYQRVLGLIESDDVLSPDGDGLLMAFVRLDQGATPVDHHVHADPEGRQEPNPPYLLRGAGHRRSERWPSCAGGGRVSAHVGDRPACAGQSDLDIGSIRST